MGLSAFVVIFEGRTGSSELMARLNKNPKIEAFPEILHPLCGERGTSIDWYGIEVLMRRIATGERVDTYSESYSKQNGLNYSLVHLHRRDLLRQSISWLRATELARRRNEWNVMAGDKPLEAIALDPEIVLQTINWLSVASLHHVRAFEAYLGRKISISYEQMFGDDAASAYSDLLRFLGADRQVILEHYSKGTPEDLVEAVSNYREIERLLAKQLSDCSHS
jgi:LPS sulfotransferase NodH